MPAPLAKGLIISLSLIFAAGLAVYESPQVRQWVDEQRRKVAVALHSLGDEIQPPRSTPRNHDASAREDDSQEAEERRRRARQEILERGRVMEERRKSQQNKSRTRSFDDLVDQEGRLKQGEKEEATATASEIKPAEDTLRKRNVESTGIARGTTFANPFEDEVALVDLHPVEHSESSESLLPTRENASPDTSVQSPATLPQRSMSPTNHLHLNTETASHHPSEQLVDLTPTESTFSQNHEDLAGLDLPRTPSPHDLPEPSPQEASTLHPADYFSVNEWAENTSASFYTPPQSEANHSNVAQDHASEERNQWEAGSDVDFISDVSDGGLTPSSWTEVGSVVSDDEH
ncbi:hypothetical protein MMC25_003185 [Agyrium rufum]|nr:hypothetical protein [Agyrium rufum]